MMKRMLMSALFLATSASLAGTAMAADGAAIYLTKCVICHGIDGKGTTAGPAFKGSEYLATSSDEEIAAAILKGRSVADKKYKEFATGMPAQKIDEADVPGLVEYLKSLASK